MINIKYMKSESGLDNCFELLFPLSDYIPDDFFSQSESGYAIELYFCLALFMKVGLFSGEAKHCHRMIWSFHYDCKYKDIPFSLYFDEDEEFVSFSVGQEYIPYREEVACYIKNW